MREILRWFHAENKWHAINPLLMKYHHEMFR